MPFVRTFLVDDHLMLTEALATTLSAAPDIWIVGKAATNDPALVDSVVRQNPDVVIIDLDAPGVRGKELLRELIASVPATHIVVLTGSQDTAKVIDAARAGADAWVPKESTTEHLLTVLRAVMGGHAWFPPEYLGAVLRQLRADVRNVRDCSGPLDVLSGKEREVLLGMVEGTRSGEIAMQLGVSPNTMRTHVRNIFKKLHVHSGLEAVKVARAAGMAPRTPSAQPREKAVAFPVQRT
ncbi:MAG: response regulator [Pseudonocardiaceae bacterium]|nr:response regulator [Pseudonocardiaceae bacterium]